MWNLLKNNEEIEALKEQINELQSRIKKQNQTIEELTGDRDYWKSEFEKLSEICNPTDSDFAKKIRTWVTNRMMSSMCNIIEIRKKKDSLDSILEDRDLSMDLLTKTITAKVEGEILRELGDIMLQSGNFD